MDDFTDTATNIDGHEDNRYTDAKRRAIGGIETCILWAQMHLLRKMALILILFLRKIWRIVLKHYTANCMILILSIIIL